MSSRFEADAFNVMNHPNFSNPTIGNLNIDNASAGQMGSITTLAGTGNRVMQFQLRFQF